MTRYAALSIESGPGVAFAHLIPDLHHYNGRSGRVFPLFCDASAEEPNVTPGLLEFMERVLGHKPHPVDLFAYFGATVAHNGYTRRFKVELEHPGVRVPLTSDPGLWRKVVRIGYEVLWLHTFGEIKLGSEPRPRFRDYVDQCGPQVINEIPDRLGALPQMIAYDPDTETLIVREGTLHPVRLPVWEYDVGGMRVIRHWFNYRSAHQRYRRRSSVLDDETISAWSPDFTDELRDIITVLDRCVALESQQEDLLNRICAGALVSTSDLRQAGALPVSPQAHRLPTGNVRHPRLF